MECRDSRSAQDDSGLHVVGPISGAGSCQPPAPAMSASAPPAHDSRDASDPVPALLGQGQAVDLANGVKKALDAQHAVH